MTQHLGLPNTNVMHNDIKQVRFTRRGLVGTSVATAAGLLALSGCRAETGPDAGSSPTPTAPGEREVTHALGRATVPAEPQRVIAVDEIAALAVLGLGITPLAAYASTGDRIAQQVLTEAGVDLRPSALVELPSREDLLAAEPDLIVGLGADAPIGTEYASVSEVAPTVVLSIEGEWRELITTTAQIFGREEVAADQIARIEARLDAARDAATGTVLSLLGYTSVPYTMPSHSPVSTLIADAGFERPAAQQEPADSYSIPLSSEVLGDHDGDLVVIPDGQYYDAQKLASDPVVKTFSGALVHPVAEVWFGVSAFAFHAIAADLEALATGDAVADEDRIVAAWQDFVTGVER